MNKLLLNHLGYETKDFKTLVIQAEDPQGFPDTVELYNSQGELLQSFPVPELVQIEEWHTGRAAQLDFSSIDFTGMFYFKWGEVKSREFPISKNLSRDKLLREMVCYFRRQRCRGEIDKVDGEQTFFGKRRQDKVDVHGGWFDSTTDTSKYLSKFSYAAYMAPQQTPLAVWSLLESSSRLPEGARELAQQEGLYGTDFLVRMCDPQGFFYQMIYDRQSGDLNMRNICNFRGPMNCKGENWEASMRQGAGIAIAAIARASMEGVSRDYTPFHYRKTAVRAYEHLVENNSLYNDDGQDNLLDYYCGLMASTELFRLTNEEKYRKDGQEFRRKLLNLQVSEGASRGNWYCSESRDRLFFHHSDHAMPAFALCHSHHLEDWNQDHQKALEAWLEFQGQVLEDKSNPFSYPSALISRDRKEIKCLLLPKENETRFWWIGENGRLGSMAAVYRSVLSNPLTKETMKETVKKLQSKLQNWLFGCNPYGSTMVEGFGFNNPVFKRDTPSGRGGICHGISAHIDKKNDLLMRSIEDDIHSWRWGEQWLSTTAWWLLALS